MTPRKVAALVFTLLVAAMMGVGGILDLLRVANVMEVIRRLGYPDYFPLLLGGAKLLGVAALLLPVPAVLREWAYAGFTFDLTAAVFSHAAVGDPARELLPALAGLVLLAGSYLLRKGAPPAPRPA
jgi:hypothetical protein